MDQVVDQGLAEGLQEVEWVQEMEPGLVEDFQETD